MVIVAHPLWPITWKHGTTLLGITENSSEGKKSIWFKLITSASCTFLIHSHLKPLTCLDWVLSRHFMIFNIMANHDFSKGKDFSKEKMSNFWEMDFFQLGSRN